MRLYFKYFTIHLKSQMQYKTSFCLTVIGQFLTSFSAFLGIYFMFERFSQVDGFEFSEVLLCFAVVLMAFSLAECFARGFDTFSSMIGNGEFDRIMVRPRNEIFQILASKMELSRIGRLIQAIIIFAYAIPTSGVDWTATKIITVLLMIISGIVIFSGLFIIYAALCFFTTEGLEFMNIFTDGGREFGRYPLSIYGSGVLKFFTYVVPLALFQYYPFLYLIGRSDNVLYMLFPLVGILFIIPCYAIWRIGLRHYKSTGS
ncbi:MAG: ABC-2 family transporter protein [Oscillospiraceae bacterium]